MKKCFLALFSLALLLMAYSCSDTNVGSAIDDATSSMVLDSNFVVESSTVRNEHIQSKTITQLLGVIQADGYGKLTSDVVTQFMPSNQVDTTGTKEDWIDSCRLALRIPTGGFTGDSLVPMRMNVYRLNKDLPSPIYSDFDPTGYYNESDLLGTTSYSANAIEQGDTANSLSYRTIYVPMPLSLGKEIFREFKRNPATFNDPETFRQFFPGMYITNSYGSGRVMNFYDTELEVYYKKYVQLSDTTDTIYPAIQQSVLAATAEIVSNNNINFEIDPKITSMVSSGRQVLLTPAGYDVELKLPIREAVQHFRNGANGSLAVVNSFELQIPVEKITNEYNLTPPQYVLLVKSSNKENFFLNDSLANNTTSFYAQYDSTNNCYTFGSLRPYIVSMINKSEITDDDCNFTLTPVDITTYTTQASYYYSSTTTVTKIAPAVSTPSLCELLIDKAKILLTYSRHYTQ